MRRNYLSALKAVGYAVCALELATLGFLGGSPFVYRMIDRENQRQAAAALVRAGDSRELREIREAYQEELRELNESFRKDLEFSQKIEPLEMVPLRLIKSVRLRGN